MPIHRELLEILCCPQSKVPVEMMSEEQVSRLNALIEAGKVAYAGGGAIEKPFSEGLITTDGRTIYRIDDDIPVMLIEQSIAADRLEGL